MDAAIISLLATLIALMFGGFWLLWRTIHKDTTAIRQTIADQNTAIRKDIAYLRQDHARLEGTLETLLKLMPTAPKTESATDTEP